MQKVWVIKNEQGYYVNPKYQTLYTGLTTGFIFYTNEQTMLKDLEMLGKGFSSEYIDYKMIPEGIEI